VFEWIRTVLREPLLHFLLAGLGLFVLYDYASKSNTVADDQIVVTSGQVEHLTTLFVKTWQRAPTAAELRGLIDNFVLEEVLYREAKSIGLDQDDTIIRRRLRQKMEFLVDDFSSANPSDDELQRFLDDDPGRFRTDDRITFEHVYLVDGSADEASAVLARLKKGESVDAGMSGAAVLLPLGFSDVTETIVASQFGESFTQKLFSLEAGDWTGPVDSPFGLHLIRIAQITEGDVPTLAEIRSEVQREWQADRRRQAKDTFFDQLKGKYTITIEDFEAPEQ
jgi:hypothetical protein